MKSKLVTIIILSAHALISFSQGNVGIGETSPASKFAVKGNFAVGSAYTTTTAPVNGAIIQGRSAIGTNAPDTSAVLDLTSTTGGLLIPRMTTTQRTSIYSPANGLIVFDTDSGIIYYYSSGWQRGIGVNGAAGATGPTGPTGATGSVAGAYAPLIINANDSLLISNAPAHTFLGDSTGTAGAPSFVHLSIADLPTAIPNSSLANSSVSGVALGGNLFSLTPNYGITGTAYNGAAAVNDWNVDTTKLATQNYVGRQGYLTAPVANASLANAAVTINGNSVSLGGSTTLSLASANFANQGDTSQVLHGNASGNPGWAKVNLGSQVTNVLPVGNGGTGVGALTQGSVVFAGSGGIYSQDNSNFFWDATTHRLGLGTPTPSNLLEINPSQTSGTVFQVDAKSAVTLTGALTGESIGLSTNYTATGQSVTGLSVALPAVTNTGASTYNYIGSTITGGALTQNNASGTSSWVGASITMPNLTQTAGTANSTGMKITGGTVTSGTAYGLIVDNNAGNVGIGTTSPSDKLQVNDGNIGIINDNNTAGSLKFYEPSTSGNNYVAFKAQAVASNISYTLPSGDGSSGQVLSTNGSGTLSWVTANTTSSSLVSNVTVVASSASSYNVASTDVFIIVTGTVAQTIILPNPAAGNTGRIVIVKNVTNKVLTLQTTSGSYLISAKQQNTTGAANLQIGAGGGTDAEGDMADLKVISTGSLWFAW